MQPWVHSLLTGPATPNPSAAPSDWRAVTLRMAAELEPDQAIERLGSSARGLDAAEAARRTALVGPNAWLSHAVRPIALLARQLRNPLLVLLGATAALSIAFGEQTDAAIILLIVCMSVSLGFINEFRSERAIQDLHARVSHHTVVLRDGHPAALDVTALVPGDIVMLAVGDIVPADVRLTQTQGLECDEAVLTGESLPAEKSVNPVNSDEGSLDLPCCAFMGTIVRAGSAQGVVVRTGAAAAFGRLARRLTEHPPDTLFQRGLRDFSSLLVQVTAVLTALLFGLNALLHHPLLESLLFALAIAVGLTPQLLPAIVTVSMASGAQRMARKSVIVKRLISIEDFGNIEVLFTDKTGTLTEGHIAFLDALDLAGKPSLDVLRLGLVCNAAVVENGRVVSGNPLDCALWESPEAPKCNAAADVRLATAPFDYERRRMSVLADVAGRRLVVVKGAPEAVLERCSAIPPQLRSLLDAQFAAGARVLALATRPAGDSSGISAQDERDLEFAGLLVFADPPKADAAASLSRLGALGVGVKVLTGDNERVAQKVCRDLGMALGDTITGGALERMSDDELRASLPRTTVFARVTPEQKSRVIRAQRALGLDVGFLGDGVNDAVALHDADVGISVDSASDVAKDAADIVLLTKDLGILADGVVEGRRIFSNTIKYILMGTSSNFGNMLSNAGGSLFLTFLPMLPSQILLNNLLYDVSEMTISTDNVDEELLQRPARWDMGLIRRFMLFFGPINSIFDFSIFGIMIWLFHAGQTLFRSGWFVENLVTQTLVVFAIRTRRVPFFRSKPSVALALTTIVCAIIGAALPFSPLARLLGFVPLPATLFAIVMLLIVTAYFVLVEVGKTIFYRSALAVQQAPALVQPAHRRGLRIAAKFRARKAG